MPYQNNDMENVCDECSELHSWRQFFDGGIGLSPPIGTSASLLPNTWTKDWSVKLEGHSLLFTIDRIYLDGRPVAQYPSPMKTRLDVKRMALRFIQAYGLNLELPEDAMPLELTEEKKFHPTNRKVKEIPVSLRKGIRCLGVILPEKPERVYFPYGNGYYSIRLHPDAKRLSAGFLSPDGGKVDLHHPHYSSVFCL
jgi:hypothetical protein